MASKPTHSLVAALVLLMLPLCVHAQNPAHNPALDAPADGHIAVPLWTGPAPGAQGTEDIDIPTLTAYLPAVNPTHSAVLVAPGGGYKILASNHEGAQIGDWLADHGVAAFVLKYRLGPKYHHPIELEDAQRALRTIRFHAAEYGIQKDHIGMWGFSAGGHLTATAGTHFDAGDAKSADLINRESSRPDFLILGYPVITMTAFRTDSGSVENLLGPNPSEAARTDLSAELHVTNDTPPTFIFSTTDDPVVKIGNSLMFYQALVEHHVPVEMHLFRHGSHGVGLAQNDPDLKLWPTLLLNWLVADGWAANR